MIERLLHSLQALAAPADVQLTRFPRFEAGADELARDYADAAMLVADCPQLRLDAGQRAALDRLDAHLDAMGKAPDGALWTADAVRCAPQWEMVRALARAALRALGAPADAPPARAVADLRPHGG